jgi:hypothetical protein
MASTAIFIKTPYNIKGKEPYRKIQYHLFAFEHAQAYALYLLNGYDLTALIGAAGHAGMVRLFHFLTLRTDREIRGGEVFVGTPLVPAGFGCFVFWICHGCVMLLLFF